MKNAIPVRVRSLLLHLALLALVVAPLGACLDIGSGGLGQSCNKRGWCEGMASGLSDPAQAISQATSVTDVVCCPNSGLCQTMEQCFGEMGGAHQICEPGGVCDEGLICCPGTNTCETQQDCFPTGAENEPCNDDGTCDAGLVCCDEFTPEKCVKAENCVPPIDGDDDADIEDGDTDLDVEQEAEIEQEYDISWPETFGGLICTEGKICWYQPWPVGHDLNAIWSSPDNRIWIAGDNGTRIQSDKESFDGVNADPLVNLLGVGGASDNDLYACGEAGTLLHWNGETWSQVVNDVFYDSQRNQSYMLTHVYADGIGNVYVLGDRGGLFKFLNDEWQTPNSSTLNTLNAMWSVPGEFYLIVGDGGTSVISTDQVQFNADTRTEQLTGENLNDVWGSDQAHVFVVGDAGTVLYYNGASWLPFDLPVEEEPPAEGRRAELPNLTGVAGASLNSVFIVGEGGAVYRMVEGENPQYANDESAGFLQTHVWEKIDPPANVNLRDVSVTTLGEVFVVGENGAIWGYDPVNGWQIISRQAPQTVDSETDAVTIHDYSALTGVSLAGDVYMVAGQSNGDIYYMAPSFADGDSETGDEPKAFVKLEQNNINTPINDIWINPTSGDVFFFNDEVYRWRMTFGELTLTRSASNDQLQTTIEKVYGFSDGSLYAVGGRIIAYNKSGFFNWDEVTDEPFRDWDWTPPVVDGDVDADVDTEAEIDGDAELEAEAETDGDLDTESETEAEAESADARMAAWRVDGDIDGEAEESQALPGPQHPWHGVWGSSREMIWVVGDGGVVARRDYNPNYGVGSGDEPEFMWRVKILDPTIKLTDIWGDDEDAVWIVGEKGQGWFYNGSSFSPITFTGIGEEETITRIWGANSTALFALTDQGALYFRNTDTSFDRWSTGTDAKLNEIWGADYSNIYIMGEAGTILLAADAFLQDRR